MPSLLSMSISRGAKPSSSIILQRHRLIQTNTPLLDVSSCHLRRYSPLDTVDNLNHHGLNRCSNAIFNQKWSNTSVSCHMICRHLSAAAIMNDSSSTTNYSNKQKHLKPDDTRKESSKTNKEIVNWRAWFRSSDYDDPWSAYRPLTHHTQPSSHTNVTNLSNNSATGSPTVVENILSNYTEWERRRHGMNLPPLALHSYSLDVVDSKSSSNDDSPTPNNQNGNNTTSDNTPNQNNNKQITQLQKRTKWIDKQTRFTIQLLNDLHSTGIRRQMDRPTTERCHRMIGRLLGLTPREGNLVSVVLDGDGADGSVDGGGGDVGGVVEIRGAAQRAKAILERMEWCSPVYLPHLKQLEREEMRLMFSRSGGGGLESLLLSNHSPSLEESDRKEEVGMSSSLERYRDNVPKHLLQTKQVIPSPTRAIYNMVLLLYGKERGSRHVAEQAEDIVWGMIIRGLQLEEFQMSHTVELINKVNEDKESALLPIYPTTQNWNCVLNCWSKSRDPNRAFFAYSFFKSWMEWNVNRSKLKEEEKVARCDLETFQLMIKSCVVDELAVFDEENVDGDHNTTTTNKTSMTQRAKEVGSRVAIGVWKDLRAWKDYSTENTLSSETYHELLIALCQSSNEPSRGSLAAVAAVFQSCRSDGMETNEITNIIQGVMTEAQYQKLMSS